MFSLQNRQFKILYAFKFLSGNNWVFEVKFLDVAKDADISEKFQWVYMSNKSFSPLEFQSMDENSRTFKNGGELSIKDLVYRTQKGESHLLEKVTDTQMQLVLDSL
jgi:hypothetical protein